MAAAPPTPSFWNRMNPWASSEAMEVPPAVSKSPVPLFDSTKLKALERQFQELSMRTQTASHTMKMQYDQASHAGSVRERIARFQIRDKPRRILVIPIDLNKSVLSASLLEANPAAEVTQVGCLDEGLRELEEEDYDLVYLIVEMGTGPECRGPCFFSTTLPEDGAYRWQAEGILERLNGTVEKTQKGATEVMVVCGTAVIQCPLVNDLYAESGRSGIFNV